MKIIYLSFLFLIPYVLCASGQCKCKKEVNNECDIFCLNHPNIRSCENYSYLTCIMKDGQKCDYQRNNICNKFLRYKTDKVFSMQACYCDTKESICFNSVQNPCP